MFEQIVYRRREARLPGDSKAGAIPARAMLRKHLVEGVEARTRTQKAEHAP